VAAPSYYLSPQGQGGQVAQYQLVPKRPSYVEQLWSNKRDVSKLILMSMLVVVALSIHYVVKFYIKQVIAARSLTSGQELMLRASYPLIMIFLVWNFKVVLQSSK
jgi:hypothetical protein